MKTPNKSKSILQTSYLVVVMCVFMSIMAFTGAWIPNRFGAGCLWVIVAILFGIWGWNTYVDNVIRGLHDHHNDPE